MLAGDALSDGAGEGFGGSNIAGLAVLGAVNDEVLYVFVGRAVLDVEMGGAAVAEAGANGTGSHDDDVDTEAGKFETHGVAEGVHGGFACAVGGAEGHARNCCGRADIDDCAGPLGNHVGRHSLGDHDQAEELQGDTCEYWVEAGEVC